MECASWWWNSLCLWSGKITADLIHKTHRHSFKINVYIGIVWLFTISGILGVISTASNWFLALTPLYLFLNFLIILICLKDQRVRFLKGISVPFILGFITEVLGVNFGLVYGSYTYGENLGLKIFEVPLIICLNWSYLHC